ncbi:MAG: hypothetical protein H8E66_31460 [Planctomycetes bacterium]|nr:hypothetical protein [Planctomycetota bacterium]
MFTGSEIVEILEQSGVTHVVWLPDSTLGPWESDLESSSKLRLIRVCREGEAWPLAAGLLVAGQAPIVMMQTTGLFESGDAMRNVLFDLRLPVFAVIGARNWLVTDSGDSARRFTEPIVQAWGLDCVLIGQPSDKPKLADHYQACVHARQAGIVLLAEESG